MIGTRFAWLKLLVASLPREGEGGGSGAPSDGGSPAGSPSASSPTGSDAAPSGDEPSLLAAASAAAKPAEGGDAAKPTDPNAKPEGEKPPETPEQKAAREAAEAAPKDVDGNALPEKYEPTMPDGFVADDKLLAEVTPLFKEAKMSPAQVQTAVDIYAKQMAKQLDAHRALVKDWTDRSKADKEIGGPDLEKNLASASSVFQQFGDPETMQVIDTYGLGNHPGLLRMFVRIGKAMGETGTMGMGGVSAGRLSDAEVMYPNMVKK